MQAIEFGAGPARERAVFGCSVVASGFSFRKMRLDFGGAGSRGARARLRAGQRGFHRLITSARQRPRAIIGLWTGRSHFVKGPNTISFFSFALNESAIPRVSGRGFETHARVLAEEGLLVWSNRRSSQSRRLLEIRREL